MLPGAPVPSVAAQGKASVLMAAVILTHMPRRLLSASTGVLAPRCAERPGGGYLALASGCPAPVPLWEILFFSL